jgi:5-methylcytosine-specific restriction endonuclease McrA
MRQKRRPSARGRAFENEETAKQLVGSRPTHMCFVSEDPTPSGKEPALNTKSTFLV